jgi:uncharacterized membrane protein YozB (DUF420 family)
MDERNRSAKSWWRRPWIAPLAVLAIAFLAVSLPPYLSGDPARSRVPASFPLHYPILVAHVLFGSVALLTACLQIWPWFRRRYRVAHRRIGRAYVFAGVMPAGLLALPMAALSPFGPVARASNVLLASLWLAFTVTGYRMARQRRHAEHRRWMIRSFALTFSIITNRIWGPLAYFALAGELDAQFGGNEQLLRWTIAGISTWLGWVIPLLCAEWWLERGAAAIRSPASLPRLEEV